MPDDRIQREIEDILSRLDAFVPEEGVASRMRRRSSEAAAAFGRAVIAPLARISLRQVMLAALALVVLGFLAQRVHPIFGRWVLVAGVILLLTSFALSLFSRGATKPERRWRGRPLELREPSLGDRLRSWLRAKRRSRP